MQTKQFQLPIFNPGKQIEHNDQIYTVDHVRVHGHTLKIKFKELSEEVDSNNIFCEPTTFVLKYIIKKGGYYACRLVNQ